MSRGDAERAGHVVAGLLLEHAHRDHGLLHLAQRRDARPQADALLRAGERLVGPRRVVVSWELSGDTPCRAKRFTP